MKRTTKAIGLFSLFLLGFLLVVIAAYGAVQFYDQHVAVKPTIEITQLDRVERKIDDVRLYLMPPPDSW